MGLVFSMFCGLFLLYACSPADPKIIADRNTNAGLTRTAAAANTLAEQSHTTNTANASGTGDQGPSFQYVTYEQKGSSDIQYSIASGTPNAVVITVTRLYQSAVVRTVQLPSTDSNFNLAYALLTNTQAVTGHRSCGNPNSLNFVFSDGHNVQYNCPTFPKASDSSAPISQLTQYVLNHL